LDAGIIAGTLILLVLLAWVVRPLVAARRSRLAPRDGASRSVILPDGTSASEPAIPQLENLLFEREALLTALRDLQMDYSMGKLSDEDFAALDAQYRERAISVLKELDTVGADPSSETDDLLDDWIERAVAQARGGAPLAPPTHHPTQPSEQFQAAK
jgi:hypothetical protein